MHVQVIQLRFQVGGGLLECFAPLTALQLCTWEPCRRRCDADMYQ